MSSAIVWVLVVLLIMAIVANVSNAMSCPMTSSGQDMSMQENMRMDGGWQYTPSEYGCGCKKNNKKMRDCDCQKQRDKTMNRKQASCGKLYPKTSSDVLNGVSKKQKLLRCTVQSDHV
jgi:hypothetical protein